MRTQRLVVLMAGWLAAAASAQVLPGGSGAQIQVRAEIGAKATLEELQPNITFGSCYPADGMTGPYSGEVVSAPMNTVVRPTEGVAYFRITTGRSLTFDLTTGSPLKSGDTVLPTYFAARLFGNFTIGSSSVPSGSYTDWVQAPETGANHLVYRAVGAQSMENWFYGRVTRHGLNDRAGAYAQDAGNQVRVIITLN